MPCFPTSPAGILNLRQITFGHVSGHRTVPLRFRRDQLYFRCTLGHPPEVLLLALAPSPVLPSVSILCGMVKNWWSSVQLVRQATTIVVQASVKPIAIAIQKGELLIPHQDVKLLPPTGPPLH